MTSIQRLCRLCLESENDRSFKDISAQSSDLEDQILRILENVPRISGIQVKFLRISRGIFTEIKNLIAAQSNWKLRNCNLRRVLEVP
jgi:hypothetical protein